MKIIKKLKKKCTFTRSVGIPGIITLLPITLLADIFPQETEQVMNR